MRWLLAPLGQFCQRSRTGTTPPSTEAPPVWTQGTLLWLPVTSLGGRDHAGHAAGGGLPMPVLPRAAQGSCGSDHGAQAGQGGDGVGRLTVLSGDSIGPQGEQRNLPTASVAAAFSSRAHCSGIFRTSYSKSVSTQKNLSTGHCCPGRRRGGASDLILQFSTQTLQVHGQADDGRSWAPCPRGSALCYHALLP